MAHSGAKVATVPVYEAVEGLVALPLGAAFPGVVEGDTAQLLKGAKKLVGWGLRAVAGFRGLQGLPGWQGLLGGRGGPQVALCCVCGGGVAAGLVRACTQA